MTEPHSCERVRVVLGSYFVTQIYIPEEGRTTDKVSSQDILQMLGRAGRPQYNISGKGVITNHSKLQYDPTLMDQQLLIQLQFVSKLANNLNTKIVLETIRNRDEAVQWLGHTYMYVSAIRERAIAYVFRITMFECSRIQRCIALSWIASKTSRLSRRNVPISSTLSLLS